jgi:hypothetical protein
MVTFAKAASFSSARLLELNPANVGWMRSTSVTWIVLPGLRAAFLMRMTAMLSDPLWRLERNTWTIGVSKDPVMTTT